MTQYLNLAIGARARLQILRKNAAHGKWVNPMTWRECRFANFKTESSLAPGFNDKQPVYYTFVNPFRRVSDAADIIRLKHTGWYTDSDCGETAKGIVIALPHGKFLAGYHASSNGETVIYPRIEWDADTAARAADGLAQYYAESEREYHEQWNAARDIERDIETMEERRAECVAMAREGFKREEMRAESAELRESIKNARENLEDNYAEYL